MKSWFSLDGRLYKTLDWIWRQMELNLLFIVGSLPIVTIGASTCAGFRVIFEQREQGDIPMPRRFWKAYKACCAQAIIVWLLMLAWLGLLVGAYFLLAELTSGSQPALLPVVLLVACSLLVFVHIFALMAYAPAQTGALLRQALTLGLSRVLESAGMVIVLIVVAALPLLLPQIWVLWLLFAAPLVFKVQAWLFLRAGGLDTGASTGPGDSHHPKLPTHA
ncbi:hypothetical protein KIM372_12560 [Bombiscardovia nodaiensis]|uniref:DUF624 domain-containing protein n=1 Tax=Bombiscardovia nodaiensis TaxID=2932181 RepID=A0ABN6SCS7_9BIFI|nr:hypothetical protein KIM372_12560 [Bombiscardovia nodaiensis]